MQSAHHRYPLGECLVLFCWMAPFHHSKAEFVPTHLPGGHVLQTWHRNPPTRGTWVRASWRFWVPTTLNPMRYRWVTPPLPLPTGLCHRLQRFARISHLRKRSSYLTRWTFAVLQKYSKSVHYECASDLTFVRQVTWAGQRAKGSNFRRSEQLAAILLMKGSCSDQYISLRTVSKSFNERQLLRSIHVHKTSKQLSLWKAAARINTFP